MWTRPREQVVLVLPLVFLALADPAHARPRRRFCENYPFAPRCLGVAAKRSPHFEEARQTPLDMYSSLIRRVFDEANHKPPPSGQDDMAQLYDGRWLDTIASLMEPSPSQHYKTDGYMDMPDRWTDGYEDRQ